MCLLRDLSSESAMKHYITALSYKDVIVGIGLDSKEYDCPPSLFEQVYRQAKADGFKLTCHCDATQRDTLEHIRQVAESIGGAVSDQCDNSLDAARSPELVVLIKRERLGIRLYPYAYVKHYTDEDMYR